MNNTLALASVITLPTTVAAQITDIKVKPGNVAGQQMLVTFKNGYKLSILNGQDRGLYTGDGTYEVAILTPEGEIDGDVYGFQTPEEIAQLVIQTASRS